MNKCTFVHQCLAKTHISIVIRANSDQSSTSDWSVCLRACVRACVRVFERGIVLFFGCHFQRHWAGCTAFPTIVHVRPAKTQIDIALAHSDQSSLAAWRWRQFLAIHNRTYSKDSDQTAPRIRRLIWFFAGCICSLVGNTVPGSNAISMFTFYKYREPSLQRQHLFSKTLPFKWISCYEESLMSRMTYNKCHVLFLHRTYVLHVC